MTIMAAAMIALAMQAAAPCPADAPRVVVPGWSTPVAMASGGTLAAGQAATVALSPAAEVRFARAPDRQPQPGSHAGLVSVRIAAAGRYRVMLDGGVWVDLIRGGEALRSVSHGHGDPCSGVRKMVDFDLKPGTYMLQLSGAKAPHVQVMLTRS